MRAARLSRCVRLLNTLQSRIGYTINDLAREFEVCKRTIHRDLRLLAEADHQLRGAQAEQGVLAAWDGARCAFWREDLDDLVGDDVAEAGQEGHLKQRGYRPRTARGDACG